MSERGDGELTIEVGGRALSGWTEIDVTLRAEGFPPSFSIAMTAPDPFGGAVARAGDPCVVKIGGDVVITGYVDRDENASSRDGHRLGLVGRGKTQDLVDCSAEWQGGQIQSATALEIATKLAQPYGITVKLADGASPGDAVPQFNLTYGESAAEIIQRVARNAGLLAYEDTAGELVLAQAGTVTASSGAKYGENVQSCSVSNAMDQRFSEVRCAWNSINDLGDVDGADEKFFFDTEKDPNVPRHRLMYLVLEAAADPLPFTIKKAKWEVARRAGRASAISLTLDSWRDGSGKLWQPNTLIPVDGIPGNRAGEQLCIAEVHFHRSSDRGTVADLYVMAPGAFLPEPISLQPTNTSDLKGPNDQ